METTRRENWFSAASGKRCRKYGIVTDLGVGQGVFGFGLAWLFCNPMLNLFDVKYLTLLYGRSTNQELWYTSSSSEWFQRQMLSQKRRREVP